MSRFSLRCVAVLIGVCAANCSPESGHRPAPAPGALHFSAAVRDAEFLGVAAFDTPLVPVGASRPAENRQFADALLAYTQTAAQSGARDRVAALLTFLSAHPSSAWKPALLVNLGSIYRQTGQFGKALEAWQIAWLSTKQATDAHARAVADSAVAQLTQLDAYLGRQEQLAGLLREIAQRPLRGHAADLVHDAARALEQMQSAPELSFKCGAFALSRILQYQSGELPFAKITVVNALKSTARGLSLSAVEALSTRVGMNYRMAFRAPTAPVVVPAVAHWKLGSYAAIVDKDGDRYRVQDTRLGEDIRMSVSTLDAEASGYFLIPAGPLPVGWRAVEALEGDGVWGR